MQERIDGLLSTPGQVQDKSGELARVELQGRDQEVTGPPLQPLQHLYWQHSAFIQDQLLGSLLKAA